MIRTLTMAVFVLAGIAAAHDDGKKKNDQNALSGIVAKNERIWLGPLINRSAIDSIDAWPTDTMRQTILLRRFNDIETRLRSELRRCEKYGLYTMVDDSGRATMHVSVAIEHYAKRYDTVYMPIRLQAVRRTGGQTHFFSFNAGAMVKRKDKLENEFHYMGCLLENYILAFPFEPITRLFYPRPR